jgi:hypothetical protein
MQLAKDETALFPARSIASIQNCTLPSAIAMLVPDEVAATTKEPMKPTPSAEVASVTLAPLAEAMMTLELDKVSVVLKRMDTVLPVVATLENVLLEVRHAEMEGTCWSAQGITV